VTSIPYEDYVSELRETANGDLVRVYSFENGRGANVVFYGGDDPVKFEVCQMRDGILLLERPAKLFLSIADLVRFLHQIAAEPPIGPNDSPGVCNVCGAELRFGYPGCSTCEKRAGRNRERKTRFRFACLVVLFFGGFYPIGRLIEGGYFGQLAVVCWGGAWWVSRQAQRDEGS
jgi:hypothetical protein